MKLKSFFAGSVEGAVDMARHELGPEAMILNSRKAPAEAKHLGQYEVVFALNPAVELPRGEMPGRDAVIPPHEDVTSRRLLSLMQPPQDGFTREILEFRKQMERMLKAVARSGVVGSKWTAPSSELSELFAMLIAADVQGDLVHEIMDCVQAQLSQSSGPGRPLASQRLYQAVAAEIEARFTVDASLGSGESSPRIAALAGPPGCGKTTTLVKLAVTHGLTARRPVQLLSMDTYRVAAAEQLRSYAAILGAGFQALDTIGALAQAIEEHRNKALILIDTPGYSARDMENGADLARFLASRPDIDRHLVLSASMKSADITSAMDRYDTFRPLKLLFTKMDETDSCGAIFSEAARTGKPLSFFGSGQEIPEDLAPATKSRVISLLLPRAAEARSAA